MKFIALTPPPLNNTNVFRRRFIYGGELYETSYVG